MSNKTILKKHKKPQKDGVEILEESLKTILNLLVSGYMLLMIAVMPFYFQEGYNHIGSDKSVFFRTCSLYAAWMILPSAVVYLVCVLIRVCRENRTESGNGGTKEADRVESGNGGTKEADRVESGNGGTKEADRVESGNRGMRRKSPAGRINWKLKGVQQIRRCMKSFHQSVTDYFAMGYAVSVLLSYVFSRYKSTALWGTEGWYMGTVTQLLLVGIYFAVSRLWKGNDWMLYLFLPVSTVVFLLGYINRFHIWPVPMENSGRPDFISTIGNINWYCGYMTCVLPLGVGMFWLDKGEKRWKTTLFAFYCFVGFATAVTQGSDSGLFALAVLLFVLFVLSAREAERDLNCWKRFWQIVLLFAGACEMTWILRQLFPERMNYSSGGTDWLTVGVVPHLLVLIAAGALCILHLQKCDQGRNRAAVRIYRIFADFLCVFVPALGILLIGIIIWNTVNPGSLGVWSDCAFFTFDAEWGSKRGTTWTIGLRCFAEQDFLHKLVGVGPDCMADALYLGGNEKLIESARQVFGMARLTNAHSEWLTILVCSGLFGAACFAGIVASAAVRGIKCYKTAVIPSACALCVTAYTCNNIWSFQQSMSVATIFLILGMGERRLREMSN